MIPSLQSPKFLDVLSLCICTETIHISSASKVADLFLYCRRRRRLVLSDYLSIRITRLALPARLKHVAHVEARKRVRLRVEHNLVQRHQAVVREQEVHVLERLGLFTKELVYTVFMRVL